MTIVAPEFADVLDSVDETLTNLIYQIISAKADEGSMTLNISILLRDKTVFDDDGNPKIVKSPEISYKTKSGIRIQSSGRKGCIDKQLILEPSTEGSDFQIVEYNDGQQSLL